MGNDGFSETEGYCNNNSIINFKLYRESNSEFIDLNGSVPLWSNLNNFIIGSLNEADLIPETFSLNNPYPNPFNPIVNIDFDVPNSDLVSIKIYDVKGRLIEELINDQLFEPGHHSIIWNARNNASGIYFVKFMGGQTKVIKKITLLK